MEVLVVGGGGREHALAWRLAASEGVEQVWVAPGNAGTAREPGCANLAIGAEDIDALLAFARERAIALTVVGPEAPLVAGIADRFRAAGLRVFGPGAAAARLEGSKTFTKAFLDRHAIPTAPWRAFDDPEAARAWVREHGAPLVVKADGLAAGKGVVVADSVAEAEAAIERMMLAGAFGEAGRRVLVEERLEGEEASFICMVGGGEILALATSQDHKPRDEGDRGPNTGGMGAYSPAPVIDEALHRRILAEVIEPTVRGLAAEGIEYTGFLYAGLMIGADGTPRVLEYNCRCGDPETQPILLRLDSDLAALCEAAIDGRLGEIEARWDPRAALGVVMAAAGYPERYPRGEPIAGLEAPEEEGVKVFHAGTAERDGAVVTAGGRVLCVCALGASVAEAQARAYERVRAISWEHCYYRGDIGWRAIAREAEATR